VLDKRIAELEEQTKVCSFVLVTVFFSFYFIILLLFFFYQTELLMLVNTENLT